MNHGEIIVNEKKLNNDGEQMITTKWRKNKN